MADSKMTVDVAFSGLCMLDKGTKKLHFLDVDPGHGERHTHRTVVTFEAATWRGPMMEDVEVVPIAGGGLQVSFPLTGTVALGTRADLVTDRAEPKILSHQECMEAGHDGSVSHNLLDLADADFERPEAWHLAKSTCVVIPYSGQIFMRRRLVDASGGEARWERWDGRPFCSGESEACLCDLIVWRREIEEPEPRLILRSTMWGEMSFGGPALLSLSITNFPPLGTLGALHRAFEHLHLFDRLVPGHARVPKMLGGTTSDGTPACPPAGGGGGGGG